MRTWKSEGLRIGFVPTMGALHEGHLDLVRLAKAESDRVVASLFVNPTQFAPHEDFDRYPRMRERDLALLASAGCDVAYCPSVETMYPTGHGKGTRIEVPEVSQPLEGQFRPHFFGGVASVVARLFLHVEPDMAVFGEKDFQQVQVIRRMVTDLGFPVDIVAAPTRRESDGLAMSSRNQYLSTEDRVRAGTLPKALFRAARRIETGCAVGVALAEAIATLESVGFGPIDYVAACEPETLAALPDGAAEPGVPGRLLVAAWMGKTRLIDNCGFERPAP